MVSPDDRPDTRRGVLKNLAAAGLGAAIATVAARELPPWLGGPAPGVPSISRPGTMDAVFNVRDQGAVGDGAADDTGALVGTIGRVPPSGGLVYLPRGTYRVTSPIAIERPNVWVFGSGPDATVIRLSDAANADILAIRTSDYTVSNLTIDGNKAHNASGAGILVDAAAASQLLENVTVRDLRVVRTKGAGIKIRSSPSGPVNRRSLVQSCVVDDTDAEGIALMATDQSIVANCFVSRTGNHGIISKQGDENTLIGNQILQAGFNKSSGFAHGIAIDGNGGLNPNGRHRIIGNYIFDACDAGIEVADAVDDIVIEGNTVNGAGVGALAVNRYGIYFGGSLAASSKGSMRGNTVTREGERDPRRRSKLARAGLVPRHRGEPVLRERGKWNLSEGGRQLRRHGQRVLQQRHLVDGEGWDSARGCLGRNRHGQSLLRRSGCQDAGPRPWDRGRRDERPRGDERPERECDGCDRERESVRRDLPAVREQGLQPARSVSGDHRAIPMDVHEQRFRPRGGVHPRRDRDGHHERRPRRDLRRIERDGVARTGGIVHPHVQLASDRQ